MLQIGVKGRKKEQFRLIFKDGQLIAKNLISSTVLTQPVRQLVEEGSPYVLVSREIKRSGAQLKPGGIYTFRATAYTHTGYNTALGIRPKRGIVAVDPRMISFGTKLYIPGYGYAVAGDTGGAIRGARLDVFFETRGEAIKWGSRKVRVTILE